MGRKKPVASSPQPKSLGVLLAAATGFIAALAGVLANLGQIGDFFQKWSPAKEEYSVVEVVVIEPPEPGDVRVVLLRPAEAGETVLASSWSRPKAPARVRVPASTSFTLDISGLSIKPQRFESVVSEGADEVLCLGLMLVSRTSQDTGSLFPARNCAELDRADLKRSLELASLGQPNQIRTAASSEVRALLPLVDSGIGRGFLGRISALVCSFELGISVPDDCFGNVMGDYDSQRFSMGILGWGSLQPLLLEMDEKHPETLERVFGDLYPKLHSVLSGEPQARTEWVRSIHGSPFAIVEPWKSLFRELGRTQEFQALMLKALGSHYERAIALARQYGFRSERAVALMYDIVIQNGTIPARVKLDYEASVEAFMAEKGRSPNEVERMVILANRRAYASRPEFRELVRERKLTIAQGTGTVNGIRYDLVEFGITMSDWSRE